MESRCFAFFEGHFFTIAGTHILATVHGGVYSIEDSLREAVERFLETGDLQAVPERARAMLEEIVNMEQRAGSKQMRHREPGARRLRALCLNVSHACNMACAYCFAGKGIFGGEAPSLMPREIAEAAVDFLIDRSAPDAMLQIDFFGGEPLLNLDTVRHATLHAKKRLEGGARRLQLTLTTNALLLDEKITQWLSDAKFSVILSLDGPPEVHDKMRRLAGGGPSHDLVAGRIREFIAKRGDLPYYVRGTYTRDSLDLTRAFDYIVGLGARHISLEPVVAKPEEPHSLRQDDLPVLEREYERLARRLLEKDRTVSFFHFNLSLDKPLCRARRMKNCGAGIEYLAVTPSGDLFPCHQFIGRDEFRMGTLSSGNTDPGIQRSFLQGTVDRRESCSRCWARFYCSGGCFANNHLLMGDPYRPVPFECRLIRKRLECALWLAVKSREARVPGTGKEETLHLSLNT
jgi:uncharacterized protein